jgi:GxxExxY protein
VDANRLTESIIGAAIEVHRHLGPGLLEAIYEEALIHELGLRGVDCERQKQVDVTYKGKAIKGQRIDLIVGGTVLVEVKAASEVPAFADAQVLTYMRVTGLGVGLLINFNVPRLVDGLKRFAL